MDWTAIFAGVAALTSILGLAYSVFQHKDNIRKEFVLWALKEFQSPAQRDARAMIYYLHRESNSERRKEFINGIRNGEAKILYGKQFSNIRSVFNLCNYIGYFWVDKSYGNMKDLQALFPFIANLWDLSEPYIAAMRSRPYQDKSFMYFEKIAQRLRKLK